MARELATPGGAERIAGSTYTIGEMRYVARHELAYTLSDILLRRTHIGFETRDHGGDSSGRVATAIADILGWGAADVTAQVAAYERDVKRIFAIELDDQ